MEVNINTNSTSFMSLEPGSMGNIFYFKKVTVPQPIKEKIIDNNINQALQAVFNPPPGLNKDDYNTLFLEFIIKERNYNNEVIEDFGQRTFIHIQIGNPECLKELETIENSPDFIRYENPHFVQIIKNPFW